MSSPALAEARRAESRWAARYNRAVEKHREGIRETIGAGITTGTAVALGYFKTHWPEAASDGLFGIPAPLAIGVAGLALGMMGVGGADAGYFTDLGRGGMAAWGYELGQKLGADSAEE